MKSAATFFFVLLCTAACLWLFLGQTALPTRLTTADIGPSTSSRAALFEVLQPDGMDENRWQRKMNNLIVLARSNEVLQGFLAAPLPANAGKMSEALRPSVMASVNTLALAVHVRQIPGTSLLELWVDCSDDPKVNAKATNQYVVAFEAKLKEMDAVEQSQLVKSAAKRRQIAENNYAQERDALMSWAKVNEIYSPLPPDATREQITMHNERRPEFENREHSLQLLRSLCDEAKLAYDRAINSPRETMRQLQEAM